MKNKKVLIGIISIVVIIAVTLVVYNYAMLKSEKEKEVVSYMDVPPIEAKSLIDNNPDMVILDVSPNYAKGHLPGAINYYIGDGSLDAAIPNIDKNAKYLVYCHVFSASTSGAQKLIDAGFTQVYRLKGEYSAWVEAGFPVEQ